MVRHPLIRFTQTFVLYLFSLVALADLTASVNRNVINEDEAFVYTLRGDNLSLADSPDFSVLERDFDILSTSRSNQIRIINGRNESWIEWTLTLIPRSSGSLTLPALEVNGVRSNPITMDVRQSSAHAKQHKGRDDALVYMRNNLSTRSLWEGQDTVLTLKIFTRAPFDRSPELSSPEVEGAIVTLLTSDEQEEKIINGIRYQVSIIKYLITPNHPGKLRIPGQVLTGAIVEDDPYGRGSLFSTTRSRRFRISAPDLRFTVKPPPANWPDNTPWLPAESVTLAESWSGNPDSLTVGDSITRTVTITAEGSNSGQIPPLPAIKLADVNSYPDQPRTDNRRTEGRSIGVRSESIALVPTQAGSKTLPAITLTWFNTKTEKLETTSLAERTLTIAPDSAPSVQQPVPTAPTSQRDRQAAPVSATTPLESSQPTPNNIDNHWQLATIVLALLWLATLSYALGRKRGASQIQSAGNDQPVPKSQDEPQLFNRLIKLCRNHQASQVETALLSWGRGLVRDESLLASDIIDRLNHPELRAAWNQLQEQNYRTRQSPTETIDTSTLVNPLTKARTAWLASRKISSASTLQINP